VVSLLRSLPDPEPHADLTARVMARVLEIEAQPRRLHRLRGIPTSRVAAALAASIAVVAVGIGIRQTELSSSGPESELAFQPPSAPTHTGRRDAASAFSIAAAYPRSRMPAYFIRGGPEPALQGVPPLAAAQVNLFDQHLDAQLNELQLDPNAFFRRLERVQDRERFIQRLAERAARRGDAAQVGLSVRAVQHRLARPMVDQFLRASLVRHVATHR
jgi:hypothetical protein